MATRATLSDAGWQPAQNELSTLRKPWMPQVVLGQPAHDSDRSQSPIISAMAFERDVREKGFLKKYLMPIFNVSWILLSWS